MKSYKRHTSILQPEKLTEIQLEPYRELISSGIMQAFREISPIRSNDSRYSIHFPDGTPFSERQGLSWRLDPSERSVQECIEKGLTYGNSLIADILLKDNITGNIWKSRMYFCDIPQMTPFGSFIISGTEKVVITQLVKSPGLYYSVDTDQTSGRKTQYARITPDKGTYLDFYVKSGGWVCVRYDRRLDIPLPVFLRILSFSRDGTGTSPLMNCSDPEIAGIIEREAGLEAERYITASLKAGRNVISAEDPESAARWFYRKNRKDGDPDTAEIRRYISRRFYDAASYDLTYPGRSRMNERLRLKWIIPEELKTLTVWDVIKTAAGVIRLNISGDLINDDIDHLANRRTRSCGEQIYRALMNGMRDMERAAKEKLSFITDPKQINGAEDILDPSPVNYAVRRFFASSAMCQFMDQTNPLAELRHKRTVSTLGPNGLDAGRAGFDVRDIHHTHYGRLCPVETPEGKNSGLISRLSIWSVRNRAGFLETPYRIVSKKAPFSRDGVVNRKPVEDVRDREGSIIFYAGVRITEKTADRTDYTKSDITEFSVVPYVTGEIAYIDAGEENRYTIAQATARLNKWGEFDEDRISCRHFPDFLICRPDEIDLLDVSPQQAAGVSAACIPFLEHDDGHRALMGTNMLSQAVPLLYPEIPLVMTGMERYAALDSAQMLRAERKGTVLRAESGHIDLLTEYNTLQRYRLEKFRKTNQATCVNQKPFVRTGESVSEGDILADAACTVGGTLALGHNPVVAFMCWDGCNFEDAIVVSESLIREDKYTSLDILQFEAKAVFTEAGEEEITRDIPQLSEEDLKHLDSRGIARIGSLLHGGDVIIGRISPKRRNDFEETGFEEDIAEAVFGKKALPFRDTSVRLPANMEARVISVKVLTHENMPEMDAMTNMCVRVTMAKKRKLETGDKMSGRHGNKGVVSVIVPPEDMPYMEDGTPVDILLNPLGVPGRMNVGQILEVWLGWAACRLGIYCETPVFDSASVHDIEAELARAWIYDSAMEDFRNEAWSEAVRKKSEQPAPVEDPDEFSIETRYYKVLHNPECFNMDEERILSDYAENLFGIPDEDRTVILSTELKEKIAARWIEKDGFSSEGVFVWNSIPGNSPLIYAGNVKAVVTCLKIWLKRMNYGCELPDDEENLREIAEQVSKETGEPLPLTGKQWLRDGRTGERFDHPVNVGVMNMIKLHHLAADKIQARSTGPYSMITQQPLGGRLNKGGQRIGEMEVWALEAYGCANLLHEMLTIKSDDVDGRKQAEWNMNHGQPISFSDTPASFRVLVRELMGLGLRVSTYGKNGIERHLDNDSSAE